MRYAAIDCGTNSIRLLIADVDRAGVLHERVRLMRIVRLGEGVDRTGEFSAEALGRTFAVCDEYAALIATSNVDQVRFVATSATRDARNREAFVAGVRARLEIDPDVISGDEEAALSFAGAVRGLPAGLVQLPALVIDIGGGSTEFVLGAAKPTHSISVDIGCVRFAERHLQGDPATPEQIAAVEVDLAQALDLVRAAVPIKHAASVVGLAGSVTTVAAMAFDLLEYDPVLLHGSTITAAQVEDVTGRLLVMTKAERAALPFMHPGRVDVIGAGAMVLRAIVRATGASLVVVSETDILDGIVYTLAMQDQ
ncbi:MAG: Ppx/GppA phosphatase family protein [Actinomycetota bacterium]|nr:Ppx/GppA phosphatase family protein [Actinomycetota bacterium]